MEKTILVIDNFASIHDFICESLKKKGFHSIGVSNETEALKTIMEKPNAINLVISDYDMAEGTGYEFINKIKSNPATENIQFMFLTTVSTFEKIKKSKETGFSIWLKKPYQMDILFAQIEKLISSEQPLKLNSNDQNLNQEFQDVGIAI